jgi:aryl-phospho-beta-D-glucosidase BglC (GH1 family)
MLPANDGIVAPDQPDASVLGSAAVPISAFANFWQQLAAALNDNPAVTGFDIMNEPNNMPTPKLASRRDQLAASFLGMLYLATARYWIKFVRAA